MSVLSIGEFFLPGPGTNKLTSMFPDPYNSYPESGITKIVNIWYIKNENWFNLARSSLDRLNQLSFASRGQPEQARLYVPDPYNGYPASGSISNGINFIIMITDVMLWRMWWCLYIFLCNIFFICVKSCPTAYRRLVFWHRFKRTLTAVRRYHDPISQSR